MSIENGPVSGRPHERLVTLRDGRQVSNYSEEWRHECEARTICRMPNKQARRNFLHGYTKEENGRTRKVKGVLQARGEAEVKRLEATVTEIWDAEFKPKPIEPQPDEQAKEPREKKGLL